VRHHAFSPIQRGSAAIEFNGFRVIVGCFQFAQVHGVLCFDMLMQTQKEFQMRRSAFSFP
jgi:hypothetical protein